MHHRIVDDAEHQVAYGGNDLARKRTVLADQYVAERVRRQSKQREYSVVQPHIVLLTCCLPPVRCLVLACLLVILLQVNEVVRFCFLVLDIHLKSIPPAFP